MNRILTFFLFVITLIFFSSCGKDKSNTQFQLLSAAQSGIDFSNDLSNADSLIAVSFEYLFNGSGVAVADFNQDGLSDIFFTANMKPSALYLNEGNLKFKDITATSQINTSNKWASGAVVTDINQDGYPDIYICVGGLSTDKEKRANLLYINQKNNTFTEEAAAYGLDDSGYSINAAFLDYDQDGDLDLYLLTTELDPYNWTDFRPRRINGQAPNTDRLYRNNGDQTFTNVSKEAGIQIEGYGLGIALCDLNKDNKTDIYIANDFLSNDIIYINNGDGTFTDKIDDYLSHTSRNGMGIDMQDFNNDGHTDIMVLDMLPTSNARQKSMFGFFNYDKFKLGIESGYQPQYPRNTLQINNGNGTFSEVGQLAGVDRTDWSWCTLFADFDNDGWQDLFVTNGYRQDITNMDFATFSRQLTASAIGTEESKRKKMMAKLKEMPEIKMPNFMFKNEGTFPFENKTEDWGFDLPTYSNGAAYADFDNDGDLDLVINNIDERAYVYQNNLYTDVLRNASNFLRIKLNGNNSENANAIGAKIQLMYKGKKQYRFISPYRGYLSTVENFQHFGLGDITQVDSLIITWPDGAQQLQTNLAANQTLTIDYQPNLKNNTTTPSVASLLSASDLGVNYIHQEKDFVDFKVQPILPHKHSQNGPSLAVGDINGDGKEDFFVGGSAGFNGKIFLQNIDGTFKETDFPADAELHDMGALLFDADQDQDLDLYIVSGGTNYQNQKEKYQDRLYINDGKGNFSHVNGMPVVNSSGASVSAADYDQDGDLDLFVAGRVRPGAYPMTPKSYLLRNDSKDGKVNFVDASDQLPEQGKLGMVSGALWTDTDNDGDQDLFLVGEFMPLTILKNSKGKFNKTEITNSGGWWNSIAAADFDQDGDLDYVAGNLGLNSRYQASPDQPVCVYGKDFDKNGRIDPVLCHYMEGTNYIAHSRDMLIKQINSMRVRFKTYTEFGSTPFERSFTKAELSDALLLKSETFATSYIENQGNGNFKVHALPTEAQVAPMYGIQTTDLNQDGFMDIIMVGNSYSTEIMAGRYDASRGLVLLGNGKGNFQPQTVAESGFFVNKDAKALAEIITEDGTTTWLATRNRSAIRSFSKSSINKVITPTADETYAIVSPQNGEHYKIEFYRGSGYLSQSSRKFIIPEGAGVEIFEGREKSRKLSF